jgi:dienelactone hydrolase
MSKIRSFVSIVAVAAGLSTPLPAAADVLEFDSPKFDAPGGATNWLPLVAAFARGEAGGNVRVQGNLTIPNGTGKVPVVVIAHTSAGPGIDVSSMQQYMAAEGYATLVYDSYRPRGFFNNNSPGNGGPKLEINQVVDAFGALKALAAHPRIDAGKAAIVGMSAGGTTALLTSVGWIGDRFAGEGGPRFAAAVSLYPGGYLMPDPADMTTGTPILMLPAEKDDFMKWTRTKVWVDYALREKPALALKAVPVPGAAHGFLMIGMPVQFQPNAPSPNCPFLLANGKGMSLKLDGTLGSGTDGWSPACFARGSSIGYSSDAANFAIKHVREFLKVSFAK